MWLIACILESIRQKSLLQSWYFGSGPQDKPIFITLAISSMIVCLMCPSMSFIATLLFMNPGKRSSRCGAEVGCRISRWHFCWADFLQDRGCRYAEFLPVV